jgi:hypothetical protein
MSKAEPRLRLRTVRSLVPTQEPVLICCDVGLLTLPCPFLTTKTQVVFAAADVFVVVTTIAAIIIVGRAASYYSG